MYRRRLRFAGHYHALWACTLEVFSNRINVCLLVL
jgi:hypothetical protein